MSFKEKLQGLIKMAFIEISKLQFTESGNFIVGDQHIHFHVDQKTFKEIVGKPELEQTVLNSTMAKLKPQENQLKSLPEDNLNQKVIMSTIESTAEALKISKIAENIGISEDIEVAVGPDKSKSTLKGDIRETASPSTVVAKTRSTGPPDDSDETM